jgi:hypothetical protein
MEGHVKILGVIYILFHSLGLLAGLFIFTILSGIGLLSGDMGSAGVLAVIGTLIAGLLIILCLPGIIGGIGLLFRKQWARILIIVVGAINLLEFPFGTALGVYTFWVLMNEQTTPLFN